MSYNKRQGQYAPKQNSIPQPIESGSIAVGQEKQMSIPKAHQPVMPVRPVTASKVSEETIKRADEYVEGRLNEFTTNINMLKGTIDKIPSSIPVTIPEEVQKKMAAFDKTVENLPNALQKVDEFKTVTDRWMIKILFFVAGIASISILMAVFVGNKYSEACDKERAAEAKVHYADSVLKEARSIMVVRETYHDFGRWMVNRYGTKGKEFDRFQRKRIAVGKRK